MSHIKCLKSILKRQRAALKNMKSTRKKIYKEEKPYDIVAHCEFFKRYIWIFTENGGFHATFRQHKNQNGGD